MNIYDIVFLGVVVLSGYIGYKRGFIYSLVGVGSYLVSFIGAKILTTPIVMQLVYVFKIEPKLMQSITELLTTVDMNSKEMAIKGVNEGLANVVPSIFSGLVDLDITGIVNSLDTTSMYTNLADTLFLYTFEVITKGISFIVFIFVYIILLFIIVRVLKSIARGINKIVFIKSINMSLGAILGLLLGIIKVLLVYIILVIIFMITRNDAQLYIVNSSFIVEFVNSILR